MGNHAAKVPFHLYCHKGNAELDYSKRTAGTVRWRVCAHTGVAVKLRTTYNRATHSSAMYSDGQRKHVWSTFE